MPKEQPAFGGPLSLKAGNVNNLYRTLEEYWSDYSKGYFYCPQGARSLSKRMPAPMPETLTSARSATRSAPTSRHLLRSLGTLLPLLTAQQLRRVADSIPSRYGDLNQQRVLVSARSVR